MDLSTLNTIAERALEQGFMLFLSAYRRSDGLHCRISLTKDDTTNSLNIKVEGYGPDPITAFEKAIANFPSTPIDGVSQWQNAAQSSVPTVTGDIECENVIRAFPKE